MDSETRVYLEQTLGAFRDEFLREMGSLRREVGDVRREVSELREEVGGLRVEVGELRGEVGVLRREVDGLKVEVGELRSEVDDLHAEVDGLRTEVGGFHGRFGGLSGDLIALRDEFNSFRQEARATAEETRRHFHVLTEDVRHDIRGVAEGVIGLSERMNRMHAGLRAEMTERFAASHAVVRVAFGQVRRDIDDLRSRL